MTSTPSNGAALGRDSRMARSAQAVATRVSHSVRSASGSIDDARRQRARKRWHLIRTHVRVTRRLSRELASKLGRRFTLAQQTLADMCTTLLSSRSSVLETLLGVRAQFLSLLNAEHCVLSFEISAASSSSGSSSVIEFDGQDFRQVVEKPSRTSGAVIARREARAGSQRPTFYSSASVCSRAHIEPTSNDRQLQNYLCLPLVDCSGRVQAVVEIFNAHYDTQVIAAWLGDCKSDSSLSFRSFKSTSEPLRVFCGFVGGLLCAAAPIESIASGPSDCSVDESVASLRHRLSGRPSCSTPLFQLNFVQRALAVDGWTVYALDCEEKTLWARLASGSSLWRNTSTVPMGQGVIGRSASTAEPLYDGDVLCIPMFDHRQGHRVNSVAVFFGAPESKPNTREVFRQCDVELCSAVCRNIGSFLHRMLMEDVATRAKGKAAALLELSSLLFRELERSPKPTAMVIAAAKTIVKKSWLRVADCNVYMRDQLTRELYSPGNATQGEYRVPLSSVPANVTTAARSGNVVNLRDVRVISTSRGRNCSNHQARPVLAVPVKDPLSGVVLAVLEFTDKLAQIDRPGVELEKLYFDQGDEDLACGLAQQLASALRNTQRLDAARAAQRKTAALLSLRLPAATGTMPGEHAGTVFAAAEAAACRALRASHGALFLVDAPSRSLFARVGADWRGYSLPIGQKLQGRVAASGAAVRLVREARVHPEFDQDYDRAIGLQTSSLLCVPIKAQPSMSASMSASSSFCASGISSRSGRRCSSSFSTSSSTDEEGDDRPIIGVFYAVNKNSTNGETEGFDAEDEQVLRAICVELSALVERRAWELVFESPSYEDSDSSDSEGESHVTRTFLSQYTTASPSRRRRRPRTRSRLPSHDIDHAAALVAATSYHEGCFLSSSGGCGMLPPIPVSLGLGTGLGTVQANQSPVLQWGLDPWQFSPAQLIDLAVDMFELHDLMDGFALPEATLRRFLHGVQAQYLDVPYHNTYHAFSTLHMTFLMLTAQSKTMAMTLIPCSTTLAVGPSTKAQATERVRQKRCGELLLAPRERLAVFVAAFCHDMGHDARTNDFHVRRSSKLARRYNDHSVLENMHAAACFETMRRPGHDVFAGIEDGSNETAGTRRKLRKRVIRAILATDMHKHASIVAKLHDAQLRGRQNDDEALRELLVDAVVHSADISTPTQSCEQHLRWTTRLLEEFNDQHAEEVELGLTATPFMDGSPDSPEFSRVNLAFVDSCAFPLWRAMSGMLAGLEGCLANLERNRAMWASRLEETTKQETEQSDKKLPGSHSQARDIPQRPTRRNLGGR